MKIHEDLFHGAGGWGSREQGPEASLLPAHTPVPGQFWKPGAPPREEMVDEEDEDELDLQCSGSYFNSSTVSAWSERSLDPGDIRVGAPPPSPPLSPTSSPSVLATSLWC